MISWYECDGRGHYEDPEWYGVMMEDREALIEGFLPEESLYIGPERRSEPSRGYVCSRCKAKNRDDTCIICGASCRRKRAA